MEIPNTVEKYRPKRSEYEELAERVEDILFEIMDIEKINYALTDSRAKSIISFETKIKNLDKKKILYDLAGIRVVGYVKSDVTKIVKIIHDNFLVDESLSRDKASELKPDQFGYRAMHLICTLPKQRTILPEYKKFKDMFFEIQVKTILEHTWAQIEHDRNYKYKALPKDIQHDFYIAAGILESADNQFESLNKRIEKYDKSIKKKTREGKLEEIELNPATFKRYMIDKFSGRLPINPTYGFDGTGEQEMNELSSMKINDLSQLEKIIPNNYVEIIEQYSKSISEPVKSNLSSHVFTILLFEFGAKTYDVFKKRKSMTKNIFDTLVKDFETSIRTK